MLFNSFEFLALLLVTFALYYLGSNRAYQIGVLIVSSFVFYAYHEPYLLSLLIFSILVNVISSYQVVNSRHRKVWAWTGVLINLSVLLFFKYSGMLAQTFLSQSLLEGDIGRALISVPLPIGISFFTFQGISLVIDVYKGDHHREIGEISSFTSHLYKTALFKSFFPALIAGPIVKAHDFYYQIVPKKISEVRWSLVVQYLILGYFLKCVLADNLKEQTFWMSYPYFTTISSLDLIAMLLAYSAQIFADFAGYSYIALGLGYLFGYELIKNFNWPYISKSFSEFWRRWHISLSSFLRQYLYIPLGGNRRGELRTYFNLFIVMFLGGLWHGAAWSYAVWGMAHGIALAVERFFVGDRARSQASIYACLNMALVFSYVTVAWLLFKLPQFDQAVEYFKSMFTNLSVSPSKSRLFLCGLYSFPVFMLHVWKLIEDKLSYKTVETLKIVVLGIMLFLILTNLGSVGAFIYFQF